LNAASRYWKDRLRRNLHRRLEALERELNATDDCVACVDSCKRKESCIHWYLSMALERLEREKRENRGYSIDTRIIKNQK
jgi:hypothetical protein